MHSHPSIPTSAWSRRFDEEPLLEASPMKVSLKLLWESLPTLMRLGKQIREDRKRGNPPVLDTFRGIPFNPDKGIPLGGLGGGTVTRGFRGDFNRWQLQPGITRFENVLADQFSLFAQRPGEAAQTQVLNPRKPNSSYLDAWQWGLPAQKGTYYALFPFAWTVYEDPLPGLRLTCKQISPFIPHNYDVSSTPAGVFVWTIENTAHTPITTALMFSFQNGTGTPNDLAGGHSNHPFRHPTSSGDIIGIELRHIHRQPRPLEAGQKLTEQGKFEDPLTFAISTLATPGVEASYRARFVTNTSGHDVWDDFSVDGDLGEVEDERPSTQELSIGAAISARLQIPAGEKRQIVFALAWDMPIARFGWGTGWYRRYTKHYGREGIAVQRISQDALLYHLQWEEDINAWQKPILENPALPDWYKGLLFNETYYLVDGGTIWTAGKEGDVPTEKDALPEPEIGHFAYLESYEYKMYNTYDVHFYSSFALATLFPELELSLQRDYIHALPIDHPDVHIMFLSGQKAPRKVSGVIPHDLGSPQEDPWRQVNAYLAQDVSRWKDLNSKFVLMIYRDYLLTKDHTYLEEAWPACQEATEKLRLFDRDSDGLIENDGYPDQTYDAWTATGPSAYSGGLWLACLNAMAGMAEVLGKVSEAHEYRNQLNKAQSAYEDRLWNGEYYNYDSSNSEHRDSIMADMLAGQWFSKACGLPDIIPTDHALMSLEKIFSFNVSKFKNGECGAINGMRPDGIVDTSSLQSREMWVGTTFALAACMLQMNLKEKAFTTAKGIYQTVYRDYGLFFQTPEAINTQGVYRAIGYMRPLAIWAMQWEMEKHN
jgi:non-lysosomal glucosylceramidase